MSAKARRLSYMRWRAAKAGLAHAAAMVSEAGRLEELAQNGSRPRHHPVGSVPLISGGADSALCAFEELAQNGSRPRRPNREFLCCLAPRDSALLLSRRFAFFLARAGEDAGHAIVPFVAGGIEDHV